MANVKDRTTTGSYIKTLGAPNAKSMAIDVQKGSK